MEIIPPNPQNHQYPLNQIKKVCIIGCEKIYLKNLKFTKMERKKVIEIAKELNEKVLSNDSQITVTKVKTEEIIENIKSAVPIIDWDEDGISKDTINGLVELGFIEIVGEDDATEEKMEEAEMVSVEDWVKEADSLKELKDLVKTCDEFMPLRDSVQSFKKVDDLREMMLDILAGEVYNKEEVNVGGEADRKAKKEEKDEPAKEEKDVPVKSEEKHDEKMKSKTFTKNISRIDSTIMGFQQIKDTPTEVSKFYEICDTIYKEHTGHSRLKEATNVAKKGIRYLEGLGFCSVKDGVLSLSF